MERGREMSANEGSNDAAARGTEMLARPVRLQLYKQQRQQLQRAVARGMTRQPTLQLDVKTPLR
jgi:hypothetical protein